MLRTHPDGDASIDWWSNRGELEVGALSGNVAFDFKTAVVIQLEKRNQKQGHAPERMKHPP